MFKKGLTMLMLLISAAAVAQTGSDPLTGKWKDEAGERVIEFVRKGDVFDAVIRKAKNASLVGKIQISGLKKKKENTYSDGTLYIIAQGKTASCSAKIKSPDELQLTGKMGLFSKTQKWTRVQE
ncbi:MAG: hypothetical protein DI535_27345 [Citrobacter freundii]|nr:MAG: hypothetical protein DI535_27345 [Citrobacter freundii]